ncbi:MAG: hypothetical protein R2795_22790 [Saprospiraceae bacterium]
MGTPVDCGTGATSVLPCDDGNACTVNDMQTVLDADGTICVPCMGTPLDCNGDFVTVTVCQTVNEALIGQDRNDWSHANLPIVNEGYLHNFTVPDLPCFSGVTTFTEVGITINIADITVDNACNGIPIYGNVLLNCGLTPPGVCPIIQDVLSPGCGTFGVGATMPGVYTLQLSRL